VIKHGVISAKYVDSMGNDLTPVNAARISFNSASESMTDRDQKLIKYLADHQHMTPFEHQTLTVIVECPLYIRSQIHRHRTFAYNEISRRYTSDDMEFYFPQEDDIRKQAKSNKQGSDGSIPAEDAKLALGLMEDVAAHAVYRFERLLSLGVAREQARSVLPQNLMTKFYMTGNLRNWCHFLKLRLDSHAQKEVQVVAQQVAAIIKERWPVSYAALMGESV
jgi:thymidylate synthase (FAD)